MLKQHQLAKKRHQKALKRKNKKYNPNKFVQIMAQKQEQAEGSTVFVDK